MKIKYEIKGLIFSGRDIGLTSITPCSHKGKEFEGTMVGSAACQLCRYCGAIDKEKHIVECEKESE